MRIEEATIFSFFNEDYSDVSSIERALLDIRSNGIYRTDKRSNFSGIFQTPRDSERRVSILQHAFEDNEPGESLLPSVLDFNSNSEGNVTTGQNNNDENGRHMNHHRYPPSSLLDIPNICNMDDIEGIMKTMDKLYDATFSEFVCKDENVLVIARHLVPIAIEYDVKQVAKAFRWFLEGWSLENIAKLLKLISKNWTASRTGSLVNLISSGWSVSENLDIPVNNKLNNGNTRVSFKRQSSPVVSQMSRLSRHSLLKLIAIMTAGETPEVASCFIKQLTCASNWDSERVTELVSFLDSVLEWDEEYFRKFTQHYIESLQSRKFNMQDEGSTAVQESKISFEYLAALYKTNLALANYRLALADFKIAMSSSEPGDGLKMSSSISSDLSELNSP